MIILLAIACGSASYCRSKKNIRACLSLCFSIPIPFCGIAYQSSPFGDNSIPYVWLLTCATRLSFERLELILSKRGRHSARLTFVIVYEKFSHHALAFIIGVCCAIEHPTPGFYLALSIFGQPTIHYQ
jgi:hypothetical protein